MEFVNMNEFKEKYFELMKVWINGNYEKFYVNNVLINDIVDSIEFDDGLILFGSFISDDKSESAFHVIVEEDKLESIEIFVAEKEAEIKSDDEMCCLKIFREDNTWNKEIILPSS